MTTKKISELAELSTLDMDDYFAVVDGSANETKKIKASLAVGATASSVTMSAGQTTLTIGTEVTDSRLEVVFLGAAAAATLSMINGARSGSIKIIVATGNNVTIARDDSYIKTKNPLGNPNWTMNTGDVVALVNVSGNPDTGANGTWLEIFRALQV